MTKSRSVMLVTHSLADGGTDRVAVHLANGIAASRPVTMFQAAATCGPEKSVAQLLKPAIKHAISQKHSKGRTRDLIAALPDLVTCLRQEKPGFLIATGNNNAIVTAAAHLLAGRIKCSLCIKITNPVKRAKGSWLSRKMRMISYRMIFALADQIWALSTEEALILKHDFPNASDKVSVVFNPYVTQKMLDVGAGRSGGERSKGQERKLVIAIGRLHFQKNYPLLINSWHILLKNWPLASNKPILWIIGEGPDRQKLTQQINTLSIGDDVVLKGYQHDIPALLAEADLLALSSDYEGLPAVVLEALAAGLPVVSTNSYPAAKSLLGGSAGCEVVRLNDAEALAGAISKALTNSCAVDDLIAHALPYRIDNAIQSHLEKLA